MSFENKDKFASIDADKSFQIKVLRPAILAIQPIHAQFGLEKHISVEKFTILLFVFGALVFIQLVMKAIGGYDTFEDEKKKLKAKKVTQAKKVIQEKKKTLENHLTIVGPSGSGKTSLFYQMYTNELRETVSSIDENTSDLGIVKIDDTVSKSLQTVDIPGHFNFRDRIQEVLETSKAIVLVIDSKDKPKLAESAEILYDIINNITVLDQRTPILVACNKQDLQFARKPSQLQQEIEKEIEEIRKVRKAIQDDQDTAQEQIKKVGYLEQTKTKFSFQDKMLPPIVFKPMSLKKGDIEGVQKFLVQNF